MIYEAYTNDGMKVTIAGRQNLRKVARIYLLQRLSDALKLSIAGYVDATCDHLKRFETDNGFLSACGALVNAARKRKVR